MFSGKLYEFDGQLLSVKTIAGRVNLAPSTIYKYLNQGYTIYDSIDYGLKQSKKVFKNTNKTNNRKTNKYLWNNEMMSVPEIAVHEKISPEPIYRRLKKGLSIKEAVAEVKKNVAPKYPYLGQKITKYQLEKLTGVPRWHLDKYLLDNSEYTEQEVIKTIDSYKKSEILMYGSESLLMYCMRMNYNYDIIYNSIKRNSLTVDEAVRIYIETADTIVKPAETLMYGNETLKSYCIKMKYNYNTIYYGIKVLGYTIQDSINRYLEFGQTSNPNFNYLIGNVLLSHFLIKAGIDDRYVLNKMRSGRNMEEAIIDAIFLSRQDYKSNPHRRKLRTIYSELNSLSELSLIKDKLLLSNDDIDFITNKDKQVQDVLLKLKLYNLIGCLRRTASTSEFAQLIAKSGISVAELLVFKEELFEGFDKIEEPKKGSQLQYIWYKGM
jgi:hypothetical protein